MMTTNIEGAFTPEQAPSPDLERLNYGDSEVRQGPAVPHVAVGPFVVSDRAYDQLVTDLVLGTVATAGARPYLAYALHVGGLNASDDRDYLAAMSSADAVYADGVSVVLLGKLAGGQHIQRVGTTDLGWDVLAELNRVLQRPARVALVGGVDGLAARAGRVLAATAAVDVVAAEHGFHEDWEPVLSRLRASRCDVLFVGLGAPLEMKWATAHRDGLPACLVMTCGGWFGFVTNSERRAPRWMQRCGLEWVYRLAQAPGRLAGRYGLGALTTARLATALAVRRARP